LSGRGRGVDIRLAQAQASALAKARMDLESHRHSSSGIFALQAALNALADGSINKANALNAAATKIPLDDRLRIAADERLNGRIRPANTVISRALT
jgi:hypothetical protein